MIANLLSVYDNNQSIIYWSKVSGLSTFWHNMYIVLPMKIALCFGSLSCITKKHNELVLPLSCIMDICKHPFFYASPFLLKNYTMAEKGQSGRAERQTQKKRIDLYISHTSMKTIKTKLEEGKKRIKNWLLSYRGFLSTNRPLPHFRSAPFSQSS